MKSIFLFTLILYVSLVSISSCGGDGLCSDQNDCFLRNVGPLQGNSQHVVFVSKVRTAGALGGLSGADSLCEKYAKEGEKTKNNSGVWKAILSDSAQNSRERIPLTPGFSIVNSIGGLVAESEEALWSGTLSTPIKYDENGNEITEKLEVWSGTLADGTHTSDPSLISTCSDWTDATTVTNGAVVGIVGAQDKSWIESEDFVGCAKTDEKARLYCINLP